jgi:hypothetical protein
LFHGGFVVLQRSGDELLQNREGGLYVRHEEPHESLKRWLLYCQRGLAGEKKAVCGPGGRAERGREVVAKCREGRRSAGREGGGA